MDGSESMGEWSVRTRHAAVEGDAASTWIRAGTVRLRLDAGLVRAGVLDAALEHDTRVRLAPDRAAVEVAWSGTLRLRGGAFESDEEGGLRARQGGGSARVATQARWRLEDDAVVFDADGRGSLILADAADARARAALRDFALVGRLGSAARARLERGMMSVRSGAVETGSALRDAAALLSLRPLVGARDLPWRTLAAIALGDADHASDGLAGLVEAVQDERSLAIAHIANVRLLGVTGDVVQAGSTFAHLQSGIEALRTWFPAQNADTLLKALGLSAAAGVAESVGSPVAPTLSSAARRTRADVAGAALEEGPAAELAAVLLSGDADLAPHIRGTAATLAAEADRPDAAAARIITDAGRLLARSATFGDADLARFILSLAHVVGVAPDATRHRLTVRARVGRSLLPLHATGIRVGDARVDLSMQQSGEHWSAELTQHAGPVPLTAILEAWVEGSRDGIRVDGQPADLDAIPTGNGWILPVQLVLDTTRRVERR